MNLYKSFVSYLFIFILYVIARLAVYYYYIYIIILSVHVLSRLFIYVLSFDPIIKMWLGSLWMI